MSRTTGDRATDATLLTQHRVTKPRLEDGTQSHGFASQRSMADDLS